jgi:hypothetical protein
MAKSKEEKTKSEILLILMLVARSVMEAALGQPINPKQIELDQLLKRSSVVPAFGMGG